MNARSRRLLPGLAAFAAIAAVSLPATALPPAELDPQALRAAGEPVMQIPTAHRIYDFEALDAEHVVLTTVEDTRYLLTLHRECFNLRFARHVDVSTSDDTIWAGFDSLTADGEACSIRAIHRVRRDEDIPL